MWQKPYLYFHSSSQVLAHPLYGNFRALCCFLSKQGLPPFPIGMVCKGFRSASPTQWHTEDHLSTHAVAEQVSRKVLDHAMASRQ